MTLRVVELGRAGVRDAIVPTKGDKPPSARRVLTALEAVATHRELKVTLQHKGRTALEYKRYGKRGNKVPNA